MSIINNIGIIQNPQAKKAFSKISFEAGEKFSARIVSEGNQKGEVNLKLLDGWQFSAKLDKPLDKDPSGSVLKFEVEGFEDDKLKIKIVKEDKEDKTFEKDFSEDSPRGKVLSSDKRDSLLFEKMIKHDMPLTKGNIGDIKNLIDFKEKISISPDKEDVFIAKYLNSRNIDPSSEKANEITKVLKGFFEALKKLDVDGILLFKENNIELTKENLDSFIKLFKGESVVYNNVKDINNNLLNSDKTKDMLKDIETSEVSENDNSFMKIDENNENIELKKMKSKNDFQGVTFKEVELEDNNKDIKLDKILNDSEKKVDKTQNSDNAIDNKNLKEVVGLINKELKDLGVNNRVLNSALKNLNAEDISLNNGTIKDLVDKIFKSQQISLAPDSNIKLISNLEEKLNRTQLEPSSKSVGNIKGEELPLNKLQNDVTNEMELGSKSASNNKTHGYSKNSSLNEIVNMIKKELNLSEVDKATVSTDANKSEKISTDFLIKEQIKLKTDEIKSIVRDVIENKLNLKPESYDKIMSVFDQKLNDIKVFNSISEQYYYLDLPINVKEDEYQCKLIIKDDRKKGKKIDGKNVKIATSVKTINMGTVDAYIKINNNNMNIDINCDKFWVKVLDLGKEKLVKDLSNLNYRVSIEVNRKSNEFTLVNCREFFDDRSFNTINIKV
jgi:transcription elongation GreA/GreB family factor